MARKHGYQLGSRFWVPLRDGGFARGLVVRMSEKGVIFAYFFGPKVSDINDWDLAGPATPESFILRGQVGDLGLINGEWKLEEPLQNWTKESWPMPPLVRQTSDGQVLVSTYDDRVHCLSERVGNEEDLKKFPRDVLMGYGSAEVKLTRLLV